MASNRLANAFLQLEKENKKAFIPFNLLGYPSKQYSIECLLALAKGGATALEVGIAFSDPLADGPVIQNAAHEVLESGFKFSDAVDVIKQVRKQNPTIAINVLSYYNIALSIGTEKFFKQLESAGADGITFVDLPIEEIEEITVELKKTNLLPIMLISPLTPEERMKEILAYAKGFIYLVSKAGITGMNENFEASLDATIKQIKAITNIPVLIGFGISNATHAEKMINLGADGVIVGTKILKIIENSKESNMTQNLISFEEQIIAKINS